VKIIICLLASVSVFASCAFCTPEILEDQKIYEDDLCLILASYKPVVDDHLLIIPKRHVERLEDLSPDEMSHIFTLIQKTHKVCREVLGAEDYLILQKNGASAGQQVPHVHIHFLPRSGGSPMGILWSFLIDRFRGVQKDRMYDSIGKLTAHYEQM
jgi:diadenosine tetraphosphate (Ap4A) HIT family hydrolase